MFDKFIYYLLHVLLIIWVVILINNICGLLYENHLLNKNSKGFITDIESIAADKEKELECIDIYNPFRWWKSYEEQTKNIKRRCPIK